MGSINNTNSTMKYINLGNSSNVSIIGQLDFNTSKNTAYLHMNITVPGSEPPGQKQAGIVFTWMQNG